MGRLLRVPAAGAALFVLATMVPAPEVPPAAASAPAAPAAAAPGRFALAGKLIQGGLASGTVPRGTRMLTLEGKAIPFASDGRFIIAFDRDAPASARLEAALADGTTVSETLAIAPRAWDISRLDTLPKYPVPQPEFERTRPGELAQITAARSKETDAAGWRQDFLWPVTGRISTLFGSQRVYKNGEAGSYHSGIDIARPTGTVVLAPADGVVVLAAAKPFTLEGNLLMIDHGMGLNTAFMHLSRIDVTVGQRVRRGQPVGAVGMTGRATGPHLHWSLKWRDARIDPLLVAGPMPMAD
ncbi:M23 family metallopeptidase [Sphingomonas canadensis]|uniref:M23 family metallopeptidase n=1 Tax=Sphingomonas canadensis TaxID=1219257 RepID=A0ABW3HA88_9SPHN|nr:M23 family metallopeptidase [Sphingomonas canadensis]MCW3837142.1 M23 family metallopeptidase [Sphingomonas canadensis]